MLSPVWIKTSPLASTASDWTVGPGRKYRTEVPVPGRRNDKTAVSYLAGLYLRSTVIWLRSLT